MKAFRVLLSGILLFSISFACHGDRNFKSNLVQIPYSKYMRSLTILATQELNRFHEEKDRPVPINADTVQEMRENNVFFPYKNIKDTRWEMDAEGGKSRLQVIEQEYDLLDDKIKVIMKFPFFITPPGKMYKYILNERTELFVYINNKPVFSSKYFGLPDESSRLLIPKSGMWFRPVRVEIKSNNGTHADEILVYGMYKAKNYDDPGGRPKDMEKVWNLPVKYTGLNMDLKNNPSTIIDDDWMNREALKKEKEYKKIQCD